jgi:F420-dependent oxidoreductase-like protein
VLRLADPTLVVLVGPSASGKSAWAAEHFTPGQVVSSDRLRALIGESEHDLSASADAFELLDRVVATRLGRRLTTVVDTLGLETARRRGWLDLATRHRIPCVAVAFDTPAAECRRRNTARDHRVPQAVLAQQLRTYATVREELDHEGFAEVLHPLPVRVVPPAVAEAARTTAVRDAEGDARGDARGADGGRLRIGLQVSAFDVPGGAPDLGPRLAEVAAAAEQAGVDSIWVMDHFRQIPPRRPWEDVLEATTTLGYLAAATSRVSVGCLVHGVTYRNVGLLGKAVATLDVLSGGRAWCGLGAAWHEAEHRAYGWEFPSTAERFALLEDALRVLPLLWGPGSPAYEGKLISLPETVCYPRPLQERVPVLVGGSGERRTLRLVAELADACNLFGRPDVVRRKVTVLEEHCAEVGRDPGEVEVTHLSTALVAADPRELAAEVERRRPVRGHAAWAARVNPGTVEDQVLRLRALQRAGVQHAILSLVGLWDGPALDRLGEVVAALR